MKTHIVFGLMALSMAVAPAAASAAKTCLDDYYQCLNDTADTRGVDRLLSDLECGLRYYGCLKKIVA